MKVSFISVNDGIYEHGLRSISSYLKKNGYKTQLIFLPSLDKQYSKKILEDLEELVKDSGLIGISCFSKTSKKAIQVINYLRKLKIPIVWGGIHATFNPEECLKYTDIVCLGEGEEAILELAERLSKGRSIARIQNLWVRNNEKIYRNDLGNLIQNLDDLPFEDYDFETQYILDSNKIVGLTERHLCIGEFHLDKGYLSIFSEYLSVHTIRGCPFSCTFCCNYNLRKIYQNKGRYVRKRSIKNVIKELILLKQRFPNLEFIRFTDDIFLIRTIDEIKEFCKEYKEKVNLPFMCYVSPSTTDEEKIKLLVRAGLKRVQMGIQTGSDRLNKCIYNRQASCKDVIRTAEILNKYKDVMDPPEYQIIITNPYETKEDVLDTIKLLMRLPKPYFLEVFNLAFFPGTELYFKARRDGFIQSEEDTCVDIFYGDFKSHLKHKFKRTHVYFYMLLELMRGVVTKRKYGVFPNFLVEFLINKPNSNLLSLIYWLQYIHPSRRIFFGLPSKLRKIYLKGLLFLGRKLYKLREYDVFKKYKKPLPRMSKNHRGKSYHK